MREWRPWHAKEMGSLLTVGAVRRELRLVMRVKGRFTSWESGLKGGERGHHQWHSE